MSFKICWKCKKEKALDRFPIAKKYPDGRGRKCKECHRKYCKERYKNNNRKSIVIAQTYARRKELAIFVDSLKDVPCLDCGEKYEPFCMDFDHLRDKTLAVAKMVHEGYSKEKILSEIEKTELICAYCHRTRTHNRRIGKEKKRRYTPSYARNKRIVLLKKLDNPTCNLCKKDFAPWHLDFDHINPSTKIKPVSLMMVTGWSEEKLRDEIKKCQLVCVVCHRRKTFKDNNYKSNLE